MISPHELIVDSFAGGGGASTGIERALGRHVDIAINHAAHAIAMHAANHPHTRHYQEDVWRVDPVKACCGRPVGLMWASPDCRHFSRAKGGAPVSRGVRGLAWVVVRWALAVRPRIILLENVEEFATWGPVVDSRPDPSRAGKTFRAWSRKLRSIGYQVDSRILHACDYGTPTTRKRLFVIARCDGEPIQWPDPTHGAWLRPWRTAREIVDMDLPCESIYTRSKPLASASVRRIEEGLRRYGGSHIVKYYGSGGQWQSLDEPLHTITGVARFGLVRVGWTDVGLRMLTPAELFAAQGFPPDYIMTGSIAEQTSLAGNSVCPPVAEALVRANAGSVAVRGAA